MTPEHQQEIDSIHARLAAIAKREAGFKEEKYRLNSRLQRIKDLYVPLPSDPALNQSVAFGARK